MTPTEAIPAIIVVFLLLSASGVEPEEIEMQFAGDTELGSVDSVLVLAGGNASIPDGTAVEGRIYVIDGRLDVAGTVDGAVTQLGGTVDVPASGTVTGEFQTIAGEGSVAEGATIGQRSVIEIAPAQEGASLPGLFFIVQILASGGLGYLVGRWRPDLLERVGGAVTGHPGVSVVTGGFVGAVALVLLIFMAFTLILLPISVLALALLVVSMVYGQVAIGYRLAAPLPVKRPQRRAVAGALIVVVAFEVLGLIPVVGSLVVGAVTMAGFGAALITYYGIQEFEPPHIPDPDA